MKVVLTDKERRVLLGLIAKAKQDLETGSVTATEEQKAQLPEAFENLRGLQRKLRLGH